MLSSIKKIKRYKDVSFSFQAHPETGDVVVRSDGEAIKGAIRNLVLTTPNERLFHPEKGCQAGALLFEQMTPLLKTVLEDEIARVINNFEPRVKLLGVDVVLNPAQHSALVEITFIIVNTPDVLNLNIILERTR